MLYSSKEASGSLLLFAFRFKTKKWKLNRMATFLWKNSQNCHLGALWNVTCLSVTLYGPKNCLQNNNIDLMQCTSLTQKNCEKRLQLLQGANLTHKKLKSTSCRKPAYGLGIVCFCCWKREASQIKIRL